MKCNISWYIIDKVSTAAGYSAVGSALRSGRRGPGFKSQYSDHIETFANANVSFVLSELCLGNIWSRIRAKCFVGGRKPEHHHPTKPPMRRLIPCRLQRRQHSRCRMRSRLPLQSLHRLEFRTLSRQQGPRARKPRTAPRKRP